MSQSLDRLHHVHRVHDGVVDGWAGGPVAAVVVSGDGPAEVVHGRVTGVAEQHQVVEVGSAGVSPPSDVVDLAACRGGAAADAAAVAGDHAATPPPGGVAAGAADVEDGGVAAGGHRPPDLLRRRHHH